MRACPNCHNEIGLAYLWNTDIVRCPQCDLGYRDRLPTFDELAQIYSDEQYFRGRFYTDYVADKLGAQLNLRHRLNTIRKFQNGGDALFEAGCAHGFFLELAQASWKRVQGIDMSSEAVTYARDVLGLDVALGDFESHPPTAGAFDAVTMWDTIEHLYDPVLAIRKSAEALRPGGILALTTGDIGAWLPRIQKKAWRLILPQHLYYFSQRSLTWLLKNQGFDIVHVSHVGYYRSLNQMAEIITWHHPTSAWRQRIRRQISRLPFIQTQIPLNLYDIIFMIGQKRA